MAYVSVPKDIVKIKEKYLNFTKRQLISVSIAGFFIFFIFFNLKNIVGIEISMYISFIIIFPILFLGYYEDDGVYLEDKIKNIIYFYKNNKPKVYKTENFYNKGLLSKEIEKIIKK